MKKLEYSGPLRECGFTGPATNQSYIAHAGETFEVADEDAPGLLARFGDVLEAVKPARRREVRTAVVEDTTDGTVKDKDAAQP